MFSLNGVGSGVTNCCRRSIAILTPAFMCRAFLLNIVSHELSIEENVSGVCLFILLSCIIGWGVEGHMNE